jgi:hypothetical protein
LPSSGQFIPCSILKKNFNHKTSLMRTLYMLRDTFFALLTVLAAAASSQAAIMITGNNSPTPLAQGGLVSYTLTAVGTAGEMINTFSNPVINGVDGGLGIHNVAQAFTMGGTPTRAEHTPGLWNAEWAPYDTYFLFGGPSDLALDLGAPFSETNDGSTSGMLGLNPAPAAPRSGYGTLNSAPNSTKVLVPARASSNVSFMQVVMRAQDAANLSIHVVGNYGTAIGDFTGANAIRIADGAPPMGPVAADTDLGDVAIVPEPATISDSSADADGNGDGISDAADYVIWPEHTTGGAGGLEIIPFLPPPKPPYVARPRPALSPAAGGAFSRYGNGVARPGGTLSPAAAPEPSSLMLLVVAGILLSCRNKRRAAC